MVVISSKPDRQLRRLGEGLTVYQAGSASRPGTYHFVIIYPDARGIQCTCEGWRFNSKCWHVENLPLCREIEPSKGFVINECHYAEGHGGEHSWMTLTSNSPT